MLPLADGARQRHTHAQEVQAGGSRAWDEVRRGQGQAGIKIGELIGTPSFIHVISSRSSVITDGSRTRTYLHRSSYFMQQMIEGFSMIKVYRSLQFSW